ncbi:MAG TPA: alpha/beta hydrolase-fold protein [Polyangiaceae bacterium]|nr:alpha/beta hydrolase-fold protein [Polyangiaceae bacterium]
MKQSRWGRPADRDEVGSDDVHPTGAPAPRSPRRAALFGLTLLATLSALAGACGPGEAARYDDGGAPAVEALGEGAAPGATAATGVTALDALLAALPGLSPAARPAKVEAFLNDQAYSTGGFPLREGQRVAFAYFDPTNQTSSVAVAGDFNNWTPGAGPMTRAISGLGFFYRVVTFATLPTGASAYKFVRGGVYSADPSARRYGYDSFGEFSLLSHDPQRSHLERWPGFGAGSATFAKRPLLVYVPPAGGTPGASLPVLYMHDGQNLFDPGAFGGGWGVQSRFDAAIAAGSARRAFVVGVPNSAARFDEYTPSVDSIDGIGTVGGKGDAYVTFLANHIKPFIDGRYPTLRDRANTAVLGSSLGGLISLYAARQRPDVFGFAGSMSGTCGWGSIGAHNPTIIELYQQKLSVELYLDNGGDDGGGCFDADGDGLRDDNHQADDNFCENVDMRQRLLALGWREGTDLTYRVTLGAQHNEAAWGARMPALLHDWFPGP